MSVTVINVKTVTPATVEATLQLRSLSMVCGTAILDKEMTRGHVFKRILIIFTHHDGQNRIQWHCGECTMLACIQQQHTCQSV